jgi:hypothetical protein
MSHKKRSRDDHLRLEFKFPADHWAAVVEVVPWILMKEELKQDLEESVFAYFCLTSTSHESESVTSEKRRAKKVADAAAAFLSALETYGPDPVHTGLGRQDDGGPHGSWIDIDLAHKRYNEMVEMVGTIENEERGVAEGFYGLWVPSKPREKVLRRRFISYVFQAWLCHAIKEQKITEQKDVSTNISEILSFVMAVVRPVLIGPDMFAPGDYGIDALGKVIDHIRMDAQHGRGSMNLARCEELGVLPAALQGIMSASG